MNTVLQYEQFQQCGRQNRWNSSTRKTNS